MSLSPTKKTQIHGRVLLVDDHKLGLSARHAVLEQHGFHVVSTSSPTEAVSLFGKETFDLVVTDFKMPEMTGADLILQLRQIRPEQPVILITGFADALGLTEESTGADVVIMKSAHEVSHLVRAAVKLLSPGAQRKPPATQGPTAPRKRKAVSSS